MGAVVGRRVLTGRLRGATPSLAGPQAQRTTLVQADHHAAVASGAAALGGAVQPQHRAALAS